MRLVLAVVGYAAAGVLLLYAAGTLGAPGLVLVALAEAAAIYAIYAASAKA